MWKIFNLILPLISRFSLHSNLINSSSIRLKPLRTEFYVFHFNSEFIRENKETSLSLLEHQVEPESGPDYPSIDFALTLAGCWRRCWTVQERDKTPVSPGSTVEAGLARSGGDHGRTTIPRQGDSHSVITPPVLQVRTTRSCHQLRSGGKVGEGEGSISEKTRSEVNFYALVESPFF